MSVYPVKGIVLCDHLNVDGRYGVEVLGSIYTGGNLYKECKLTIGHTDINENELYASNVFAFEGKTTVYYDGAEIFDVKVSRISEGLLEFLQQVVAESELNM